jgi:hypothetical protein
VGDLRDAISEEIGDDVLMRVAIDSGEVVGLTILNFASRFSSLKSPQTIPVEIALKSLVQDEDKT